MSKPYLGKSAAAIAPSDDDLDDKPKHVLTRAGATPHPETTAANSVFAAARPPAVPKKPRAAPMTFDFTKLTIRKDVPLPPRVTGVRGSPYAALLAQMKAGDSVEMPDRQAHGMATAAKKLKIPHAVRRLGPGLKGFWRTA